MHYLLLGEDSLAKDQKIAEIKKKYLPTEDALKFDYVILYAKKLEPSELKKTLIALPAISSKRLIVIRSINQFNTHNKDLILNFVQDKMSPAVLVMDTDEEMSTSSFLNKLMPFVKMSSFQKGTKSNVFDMTRKMASRNSKDALKILFHILSDGDHPLQIMGGLVWFWGKQKDRLSQDQYKAGLRFLKEADLNIKRSRLNPEYAMEVVVVKLCNLM